jgi:hypothetical protein
MRQRRTARSDYNCFHWKFCHAAVRLLMLVLLLLLGQPSLAFGPTLWTTNFGAPRRPCGGDIQEISGTSQLFAVEKNKQQDKNDHGASSVDGQRRRMWLQPKTVIHQILPAVIACAAFIEAQGRWATPEQESAMRAGAREKIEPVVGSGGVTATINEDDELASLGIDDDDDLDNNDVSTVPLEDFNDSESLDTEDIFDEGGFDFDDGGFGDFGGDDGW